MNIMLSVEPSTPYFPVQYNVAEIIIHMPSQ